MYTVMKAMSVPQPDLERVTEYDCLVGSQTANGFAWYNTPVGQNETGLATHIIGTQQADGHWNSEGPSISNDWPYTGLSQYLTTAWRAQTLLKGAMPRLPADCNFNGIDDVEDLAAGTSADCNSNGVPDECDVYPTDPDFNGEVSLDCQPDLIPDECQLTNNDCNTNSVPDGCDIVQGTSHDCQPNSVPDECDLAGGTSVDADSNGVPDECEPPADCNSNGVSDEDDIASGISDDCNVNGVPDECEPDCNANTIADDCELAVVAHTYSVDNGSLFLWDGFPMHLGPDGGYWAWINHFTVEPGSEIVGEIEVAWGGVVQGTPVTVYLWSDPNGDGDPLDAAVIASVAATVQPPASGFFSRVDVPDTLVGPAGTSFFAGCVILHGPGEQPAVMDAGNSPGQSWLAGSVTSYPIDPNNLADLAYMLPTMPSEVYYGMTRNWLLRAVALEVADCDANEVPDECESYADCNANDVPDVCDIASGSSENCNTNDVPDECEPDFDADGTIDDCDPDIDNDGVLNADDLCEYTPLGARVDSEGRPLGDLDKDCDTDLDDYALFQQGFTGP